MKVFIAGPRVISVLDTPVVERLNNIYTKNYTVLVGDAGGVDSAVQKYFSDLGYGNVVVFASEGKARNNIGRWEVRGIDVPARSKGFSYYTAKDKAMAEHTDYGFMIWNGESKGTLNNIINLVNLGKSSIVYLTIMKTFYSIEDIDSLQELLALCGQSTRLLFERLSKSLSMPSVHKQISLF